jgi:hypothetical protein
MSEQQMHEQQSNEQPAQGPGSHDQQPSAGDPFEEARARIAELEDNWRRTAAELAIGLVSCFWWRASILGSPAPDVGGARARLWFRQRRYTPVREGSGQYGRREGASA